MSHTVKLWERVIKQRLGQDTHIIENLWFYAWKGNHGSNILATKIDGAISDEVKWLTYDFCWFGRDI